MKKTNNLAEFLSQPKEFTKLDLSDQNLDLEKIKKIASVLNDSNLKILNLSNSHIGYSGIKIIAQALESNMSLKELDLSYNDIGEEIAKITNKSLVKLSKYFDFLEEEIYVSEVVNALSEVNAICADLRLNMITYLAEAIKNNSTLSRLNLKGNKIEPDHKTIIINALQNNNTLKILEFSKPFLESEYNHELLQNDEEIIDISPIGEENVE